MKRLFTVLFAISLLLCSCSMDVSETESTFSTQDAINTTSSSDSQSDTSSSNDTSNESPSSATYDFYTYEEFADFLGDAYLQIQSTDTDLTKYQLLVTELLTNGALAPYYNGSLMALGSLYSFQGSITLFESESFKEPWIWYRSTIDDQSVTIRVMVLDKEYRETANTITCSELLKLISPNAANIDNYQEKDGYRIVYESEVALANGTFSALIYETTYETTVPDEWIIFVQDDYLVVLKADIGVITQEWLQGLSFAKIDVTPYWLDPESGTVDYSQ